MSGVALPAMLLQVADKVTNFLTFINTRLVNMARVPGLLLLLLDVFGLLGQEHLFISMCIAIYESCVYA